MQKILAIPWLYACLIFISIHVLARDDLLLQSDFLSLLLYASGIIGILFIAFLPPILLSHRVLPAHTVGKLLTSAAGGAAVILGWLFLIGSFRWVFPDVPTAGWQRSALFYGGALVAAMLLVRLRPGRLSLDKPVLQVATLGLMLWGLTLVLAWPYKRFQAMGPPAMQQRHAALLVLDALPVQALQSFNPATPLSKLDEVLANGTLWDRVYSWNPWTHAWFGTLYNGRSHWQNEKGVMQKPLRSDPNLFGLLAEADVRSRWVVFHRNGSCEGSAGHTTGYPGVRSHLLGPGLAWLPAVLGVDFHLMLSSDSPTEKFTGNPVRRLIFSLFNPVGPQANVFMETLLPELKRLRRNSSNSLLVFHVRWDHTGATAFQPVLRTLEDSRVAENIRRHDYAYAISDSDAVVFAQEIREGFRDEMNLLGARLAAFLQALNEDSNLKNTDIFLTSDHGTVADDGKIWYGYHTDERVVRIPFAHLTGAPKRPDGMFFTPDIPATFLDWFEAEGSLGLGRSLLRHQGRDSLFCLALNSETRKSWPLALYRRDWKFEINIHPQSDLTWAQGRIQGMHFHTEESGSGLPSEMAPFVGTALHSLGVPRGNLHPGLLELTRDHTGNF